MRTLFNCEVGLSDHTMGIGAAVAAVAHGATVIGSTSRFAAPTAGGQRVLTGTELHALVVETERAWQSLGRVTYGPSDAKRSP